MMIIAPPVSLVSQVKTTKGDKIIATTMTYKIVIFVSSKMPTLHVSRMLTNEFK